MSLHADLLKQAQHLARRERHRPRQASLRRAISAAYYALFHLLIREATVLIVGAPALRGRFARAFDHSDMKQVSRAFSNPQPNQLPSLTGGLPVPADLCQVALAFVQIQEARHEADYDLESRFSRLEAINLVARVQQAFQQWQSIRTDPAARAYLAALLLWKKWHR